MPGLQDLLSVFFFKASAYEIVQQNSRFAPSYYYSFNYSSTPKSVFHLMYLDPETKAGLTHPGTSHGDELMYEFNLELPLVLCDIEAIVDDALFCLTLESGKFRSKWHDCLTGRLNAEELQVSA